MLDFSKTRFSRDRPLTDYAKVRALMTALRCNNPLLFPKVPVGTYLNVGCGAFATPGFINIDRCWAPGVDLCCDVTRVFPIPDGVVGGVYSEHCLEHLSFDHGRGLLAKCLKAMRPGAWIRLVVPDLEKYVRFYIEGRQGKASARPNVLFENEWPINLETALFNDLFGPDHLFIYDHRSLAELLAHVGFTDIQPRAIGEGADPRLLLDSPGRLSESLYMEARKPV